MKLKRLLSLLLSAILMTSMLASCGEDKDELEEEEEIDKGAIIDMYFGQMPDDFDPTLYAVNSDKYLITSLLFEGLTGIDENGKLYKAGADEWEYEVDERDGQLKLLVKLKSTGWSDGIAVRADDYVFAWKKLLAPSNSNPAASLLYPVKNARKVKSGEVTNADFGAVALSESLLEITFEPEFTDVEYFLKTLASPMLVPLREDKVKDDNWSTKLDLFVSNGPFAIKSISEDRLLIERSTHYNALRANQKLTKYVNPYRIIAHFGDEEAAFELYNNNELFYMSNLSKEAYEENGKKVKTNDDLATYTYYFNTKNDILASASTRKALVAALDRNEIAAIRGCGAEAATGLVPTGVFETGTKSDFRKIGGNVLPTEGTVESKGTITLTYNEDRAYEQEIAKYVQGVWGKLGVTVNLNGVAGTEIDDIIKSGEFDVIAADYISYTSDAYGYVAPFAKEFSGSYVDVTNPDVFFNAHFTGFESEEYNALIETLYLADNKTRASLLHDAEKMLMEEAPVCPLFFEKTNYMSHGKLSKFSVDYRGATDFRRAKLKGYKAINEAKEAAEEAERAF